LNPSHSRIPFQPIKEKHRMQGITPSIGKVTLVTLTGALLAISSWASEKVIHNFGSGTDGQDPQSSLIFDGAGNLYGTTYAGGSYGLGTVFRTSPNGSGGWTTSVLHSFRGAPDGANPYGSLVIDSAGNLYGTTYSGGGSSINCTDGCGTVFETSPNGSGGWTTTVIHSFNGSNGQRPYAGLIMDGAGNLYGTAYAGGSQGFGVVFEMSPNGSGGWTTTVLHNLGGGSDGQNPKAGLTFDSAGNLYGTTTGGGGLLSGVVFEMTPNGSGGWTERVIHNFGRTNDGSIPQGGSLVFDGSGNLYGTCELGGSHMAGAAFEMLPNGSGGWTEKVIHNFGRGTDGTDPYAGLIFDAAGNLYGTTTGGGTHESGTAFKMTPNGSGGWTTTILHNFGLGLDGSTPADGLIFDGSGNLYGTTSGGGSHDEGTVFEVTP
jgi:uncharacterized repeat protein (TIGR03803 family)